MTFPSVSLKCIEGYKSFFQTALEECHEPENKWKCTEPKRERMSDDLMEINDMDLN